MKRIIAIFLLISLLCFSACTQNQTPQNTTETSEATTSVTANETLPTEKDAGGGSLTTRKYRVRYYSIPYQFVLLVGEESYREWRNKLGSQSPDDTNEMVMKKFVQHFNISREDFEKANLEFAKVLAEGIINFPLMNPKDYADQEVDEIFNPDIIYTFDDEIINNYYLSPEYPFGMWIEYNDALEAGVYETRTTDWVDIDQMEAEIIAKYGEAEIVTEAEATVESETENTEVTEEIVPTDLVQTETNE